MHDGEQWLVQRYRINNITAASLTELNTKPQSQLKILAEALRQAQIALITGDDTALAEQRGSIVAVRVRDGLKPEVMNRLNHPYYWAPFILIGNGL